MDEIQEFVDERQKGWCLHCARALTGLKQTRDHVPTKTLLRTPYPANLPIVPVCGDCNQSFSKHEQYLVAFLSAVISGSADPDAQASPAAQRILKRNTVLRAAIDNSRKEYRTASGETRLLWTPDESTIRKVVVKNARGHAFFEYGEPILDEPASVSIMPFATMKPSEREAFEDVPSTGLWPEVGSRMMTRVMTGQDLDGPWVIVQDGVYRYNVTQIGRILVRSVMSEYLATEVYWDWE
jgi:hypothetical protein